jgi:C4-dicarboxylate-specific signal transduction histidine kinase
MTPPKNSAAAPRRAVVIFYRTGLAVALVAIALALTFFLKNFISTAGSLFFYAAVMLTAWFGGKWSGGLAAILSVVLVDYFFTVPPYSFVLDSYSWPVFIEFAASAAIVGWFSSWRKQTETALQRARDDLQLRVEERTADLKQTNEQLLAEMAERRRTADAFAEAQAELARVTRMSTLGALAAAISHEVNQPLAAVVANADACMMWLSLEPPNLEEARAAVDAVAREGTRASDVVRGIRAMFAKTAPENIMLDVNDLIREVGALMQNQAGRNDVVLQTELAPQLPAVLGDRVQLQQVVVNLAQNGIEAMIPVTHRPRTLIIRSRALETGAVLIAVEDSGIGIDLKNDRRMFDSFFTTKARGMGMGLSISHSIIENHGGKLWAVNNSEYGATLQFTLPLPRETAA